MSLCLFIIRLNYLLALLKDVAVVVAAGDRLQYSRGQIQSLLCNFLQREIVQARSSQPFERLEGSLSIPRVTIKQTVIT